MTVDAQRVGTRSPKESAELRFYLANGQMLNTLERRKKSG